MNLSIFAKKTQKSFRNRKLEEVSREFIKNLKEVRIINEDDCDVWSGNFNFKFEIQKGAIILRAKGGDSTHYPSFDRLSKGEHIGELVESEVQWNWFTEKE